jgi:hypothetical protein
VLCSRKRFETQFKQVNPRIEPGALTSHQAPVCRQGAVVTSHYVIFEKGLNILRLKVSETEYKHESNPVL